MTELHEAVKEEDVAWVRRILQRNPSCVNDRDGDYKTPLHLIEGENAVLIGKLLLYYGADVNAREEKFYRTPLHIASEHREADVMKLLLENGADPNLRDADGNTALHSICVLSSLSTSYESIIQLLLQHGAEINAVNNRGWTLLDEAIYQGSSFKSHDNDVPHLCTFLMKAGAKARDVLDAVINLRKYGGGLVKFLFLHGAKICSSSRFSIKTLYLTCLMMIRLKYDFWLVGNFANELIGHGIYVNSLNHEDEENTELHTAVKNRNEAEVKNLLRTGADVNARNVSGRTPLHLVMYAVLSPKTGNSDLNQRIAQLLIEAGAELYVQDCLNVSPFELALKKYPKIFNLMLAKVTGIDENKFDNKKCVSYTWKKYSQYLDFLNVSVLLGYAEAVDSLIDMQYHVVETSDLNYKSPLYYAVMERNYQITKMLLEAGCRIEGYHPSIVPKIDLTKCDDNSLELICLLWEYDCISILRRLLVFGFSSIIRSSANKLKSLLVFYYKLGLRTNKLDNDFIPLPRVFYSSKILFKSLSSIFASCDDQIDQLQKDVVCGCLSKFNLLTMKQDSLVKFLNCENNLNSCKKLLKSFDGNTEMEYHDYAIKIRLDLAIEKRKVLDAAKDNLYETLRDDFDVRQSKYLPDEVVWNILSYLNVRELKKMSIEH